RPGADIETKVIRPLLENIDHIFLIFLHFLGFNDGVMARHPRLTEVRRATMGILLNTCTGPRHASGPLHWRETACAQRAASDPPDPGRPAGEPPARATLTPPTRSHARV